MRPRASHAPRPASRPFGSGCVVTLAAFAVACAPTVRWASKIAPDFAPSGHTVSVLGVYKDGQMSPEAWDAVGPSLAPLLGGRSCETAQGSAARDSPLTDAIDDYARTNGPTDELLEALSPAALGDLILVVVEAGSLPPPEKKASVVDGPSPAGPSPNGSHGSAGLSTFATKKRRPGARDSDVLQLSLSLFSVARGRSVALLDMQYSGDSAEEATREFAARVARQFPGTTCRGWHWDARVDPERIRRLTAQEGD